MSSCEFIRTTSGLCENKYYVIALHETLFVISDKSIRNDGAFLIIPVSRKNLYVNF